MHYLMEDLLLQMPLRWKAQALKAFAAWKKQRPVM
jgi:hypothetical protein